MGISVNDQKVELEKLRLLVASPECGEQCRQLAQYSISQLEPVINNTKQHQNNVVQAATAGVIFGLLENLGGKSEKVPSGRPAGSTGSSAIDDIVKGNNKGSGKQKDSQIWTETKKADPVSNAYGHWDKHKSEFPEFQNSKQYVDATHDFVRNPPNGTLSKTRSNGDTIYYNPSTNTFAVKNADGTPKTMFRPDPADHGYKTNLDYYNAQK